MVSRVILAIARLLCRAPKLVWRRSTTRRQASFALHPADDLAGLVDYEDRVPSGIWQGLLLRRIALCKLNAHVPITLVRVRIERARCCCGASTLYLTFRHIDGSSPIQRRRGRDPCD